MEKCVKLVIRDEMRGQQNIKVNSIVKQHQKTEIMRRL